MWNYSKFCPTVAGLKFTILTTLSVFQTYYPVTNKKKAHTNTVTYTQNILTHKQSHTNSTQQTYHNSPSSHNHNNLVKKREVEASKQDPGKDNIADLLTTQPIVF